MNLCPISVPLLFVSFLVTSRIGGTNSTHFKCDISINCGSNGASATRNGLRWFGDVQPKPSSLLQINGKSTTSTATNKLALDDPVPHKTARISHSEFSYEFQVDPGEKIIRLHFNPSPYKGFRGFKDLFTVQSGGFTLLSNFSASLTAVNTFAKEFCLNIQQNQQLTITFSPETSQSLDTYAFINGIEIISVPASLSYFQGSDGVGKESVDTALEIIQRQNLKHDPVSSNGDSMFPKWATAEVDRKKSSTWNIPVEVGFRYLVRLHFSELGLKIAGTGELRFKVFINDVIAQTNSDILRASDGNYVLLYRDYTVMMPGAKTDGKRDISISILSSDELREAVGVLAGFEIVKLSNPDKSLASPNPLPPPLDSLSKGIPYLLSLLGHRNAIATVAIAIISLLNVIVYKLRDIREGGSTQEEIRPSERAERLFRQFSLAEIQLATKNFNGGLLIGKGGFGQVYKGLIDEGQKTVAVKRLKSWSNQGEHEFLTEIETLSDVRHINLVSLIGYCRERREMILVYEYMPNGTLSDHLYKIARRNRNCSSLTWKQRLNICIEAGRGLDYLHTGQRVIHRDVKPSNILLDRNFVAKVSDFGLAKYEDRSTLQSHVSTKFKGTFGYIDPYYLSTQRLSRKSDTYAFGVVLLEVLCGRPAVDSWVLEDERVLTKWALDKISKGEVDQIVALNLREEVSPYSLKIFVGVAEMCLQDEPKNRPTMAQVVLQLELALEQQESKIPMVLNEMQNASAEIEQSANKERQPTMAINNLQNVTHPPTDKPSSQLVVNPEPTSGREVWRKSAKHKLSRFWPRGGFWNRANTSKKNELSLSDWNKVSAAASHLSSLQVGHGALGGVYKAALSTGKGVEELKNEVLLFHSLQRYSSELIYVNDEPLCAERLVFLQSCRNPPKKLRPGRYWYDKVSGFWGKDGEKPCQLISPNLAVGYQIRQDASHGDTNVLINGREITKAELWMLRAAGVECQGNRHFWVSADGACLPEGTNTVIARLWEKKLVKMFCATLDLPFPSDAANPVGVEKTTTNKLLLVGCDQSGTSTIFKQAKIMYKYLLSEDEKQNIKIIIQRNLYRCIGILLEGRQQLKKYHVREIRRKREQAGSSGNSDHDDESSTVSDEDDETSIFSLPLNLEAFSNWLVHIMKSGNLEVIIPDLTRELSPIIDTLWKDRAFQAIYSRRNKLPMLPRDATYFLDRAVEISRVDYEPSGMDILYSEDIPSNEVASNIFYFPKPSDVLEYSDIEDDPLVSYQLSRARASSLVGNRKLGDKLRDVNLVICCVALTDYAENYEDVDGLRTNKMLENKKLFEKIVTHPTLADKHFLLVLNKFDLLEEMMKQVPLSECSWFRDFNPVILNEMPQCASFYVGWKFKRTFRSLTGRKLFVAVATALDATSVDQALRYGKEILKWENDAHNCMLYTSSDSVMPSLSIILCPAYQCCGKFTSTCYSD